MELVALENLLKASMGLNAVSIGSGAIARAVGSRQQAGWRVQAAAGSWLSVTW